ncbi:penicillin-binding transpeptidase domain-containing protein [Scatolibacter rhodanostii]|uniref:penicillin-binding transpeptidase domain-containing protein n=1 Tax=Scatolibacter rhodanostii TaxID=2014781 RepID=UPI000C080DFC|nr:penicillin-binding transpeptidase domain-containing protein [Scatolibacter rhodanostii]
MRTTGKRSIVLYIALFIFVGGLAWFFVSLYMNGSMWAMQPYNRHISLTAMGKITDRNGNILAESKEGARVYSESEDVRKALLHTIGDNNGSIGTSVQATMHSKLSGYNFITGSSKTMFNSFGNDIKLTIDTDVSLAAYYALGSHRGAAIMYNYKTGDILAKVSQPTFDPSNPPEDILENDYYKGAYVDRVLSSSFTPGSIFKIVTLAAAMDKWPDSWAEKEFTCEGSVMIGGAEITCMGVHGVQNAQQALGNSCNVYFSQLAVEIGADALQKKAVELGFNKTLSFQGIDTAKSSVDLTQADSHNLGWSGIGQYTDLANPYHMMTLMGAIATDGSYVQPKLTNSMDLLGSLNAGSNRYMNSQQAEQLRTAMRTVVSDYYGDSFFPADMQISAKTGTAEVGSDEGDTCWIVGFSNNPNTPYAFAVVVEEGESALQTAGSVAVEMLQAAISE